MGRSAKLPQSMPSAEISIQALKERRVNLAGDGLRNPLAPGPQVVERGRRTAHRAVGVGKKGRHCLDAGDAAGDEDAIREHCRDNIAGRDVATLAGEFVVESESFHSDKR